MASLNKVILIGNAGRDAEVRYAPSGAAVANVSIATTRRWKDKTSGEQNEETDWHRLVFYDRLAEVAGEYVLKGTSIYVEGRIKYGKYTDKDGIERNTVDIVVSEMKLLGGKRDADDERPTGARGPVAAPERSRTPAPAPAPRSSAKPQQQRHAFDDMDDDIPF